MKVSVLCVHEQWQTASQGLENQPGRTPWTSDEEKQAQDSTLRKL